MFIYTSTGGSAALSKIALSADAKPMAENLYRALWSWLICVGVTVVVSLMGKPIPTEQLAGLVYGATPIPDDGATTIWQKPVFWAIIVIIVFFVLNIVFF
jgi:SSS family solute:Na+ symporter